MNNYLHKSCQIGLSGGTCYKILASISSV